MKIVFIVPYFGTFPDGFNLLLKSIEKNKENYTWLFFTDDRRDYDWPSNTIVKYGSFSSLKKQIQKRFDFPVSLERPYKLCDYKPAYGYIFEKFIEGYDFWGHCDIDCIYGKLDHFFTDEEFKSDKILRLGHMTLYRNTKQNNRRFMDTADGRKRYKEVYTTEASCAFDENNSMKNLNICDIWREHGYSECLMDEAFANIWAKGNTFRLTVQKNGADYEIEKKKRSLFIWKNGILKRLCIEDGKLTEREYLYIHMMGRAMKNLVTGSDISQFKIIPNQYRNLKHVPENVHEFYCEKWRTVNCQYVRLRTKYLWIKLKRFSDNRKKNKQ